MNRPQLFGIVLAFVVIAFLFGLSGAFGQAPTCKREALAVVVDLSHERHAAILAHERRALEDGERRVLTLERTGATARRRAAVRHHATAPGMERDEYPPALSAEGGAGSSVELVPERENASSGSLMGAQLRPFCDGQRFVVEATP